MKKVIGLVALTALLVMGLNLVAPELTAQGASPREAAQGWQSPKLAISTQVPVSTTVPLLLLSKACLDFNFKNHDAAMGMNLGSKQFNAGETITITGEAPFSVQIDPGGNSYPSTSFSYTFPSAGTYSIKVYTNPDTGIPQHFAVNCTILSPLPAGQTATPTPMLSSVPITFSKDCTGFNFKNRDATMGMSFGAVQFNAGETITFTGEAPFSVQINPGGNSYPATSFTYTFPTTGTYSIKVYTNPDTGIPQHFAANCTVLPPLPAGQSASPTPVLAATPITFSKDCAGFNFKNRDATMGMGFGAVQFNAGETLTITGEGPFSVQINPGGNSYPATSFTYTFPATGTYSIKVYTNPDTGIPQHFTVNCTVLPPLPAGVTATPTPVLAGTPIIFSQDCKSFNFRDRDATMGMGWGSRHFNAGETLTITGESTFTVQIDPGGTSYPVTTFTYTVPTTGAYAIKIVSSPKQVAQHFELHCTILPSPLPGVKTTPTPPPWAPPAVTGLQAPAVGTADPKVCQPFKFLSVKPYGPALITWAPSAHVADANHPGDVYWYGVTITATTDTHVSFLLVNGWVDEPTTVPQSPALKATFPYALPAGKRIQSYTVTIVAGYGSADYPDNQDGTLKQDCTITTTLLVAPIATPVPPTPIIPTVSVQAPPANPPANPPSQPQVTPCPGGTTGDPAHGVPCMPVPK